MTANELDSLLTVCRKHHVASVNITEAGMAVVFEPPMMEAPGEASPGGWKLTDVEQAPRDLDLAPIWDEPAKDTE